MTEQDELEGIRRDAERVFWMRVSFAVNTAVFILAILLTEGALVFRWRLGLSAWLVVWMLHGVVLALFEIREGEVRRAASVLRMKRKREAMQVGLGADGEVIRLEEMDEPAAEDNPFEEAAPRRQRRTP